MLITNLEKGENYNLSPDTQIQVERTNPFFNNYGEQTTPLSLPASEKNRRLLGFPDTFGRREKMSPVDVAISDGEYFAQCRQIVLSAQYKGSISTSFYINDGSFYSRIQNVRLKDIFGDELIPDVNTTEQGIDFCRRLRANTSDRYGIFPVLLTDDSGLDTGFNYKILNAYGKTQVVKMKAEWRYTGDRFELVPVPAAEVFNPDADGPGTDFYNAVQRTEYVSNVPVTLAPGYYISPFIRANYLLQRIFSYFGYALQDNFFSRTEPFSKMVVINNVIDVLVNGHIRVADLVPDVTCADFIAVFRKKFCCEFTSDEGRRTASVIFLNEALRAEPAANLTTSVVEEPVVLYKDAKSYKRLTIGSADKVDTDLSSSYDSLKDMLADNPAATFNPVDGAFYKQGFSGNYEVITKLGEASQNYNTGDELEPVEVKVPDLMPEFRQLTCKTPADEEAKAVPFGSYLYVGSYIALNSKMLVAGEDKQQESSSPTLQKTILAFSYLSGGRPEGIISSYDICQPAHPRIFNYALFYNGPDGIFERFYRPYDLLLRNSLHETKVKLLLSQSQKQNLPAHARVAIRGTDFFFNKLKFTLGGHNEPVESELYTLNLMQPVSSAPGITGLLPAMKAQYKWVGRERLTKVSEDEYENSGLNRDRTFTTIYPPIPSLRYVGQPYALQTAFTSQKIRSGSFWRHSQWEYTRTDVWLECVPV